MNNNYSIDGACVIETDVPMRRRKKKVGLTGLAQSKLSATGSQIRSHAVHPSLSLPLK